MSSELGGSARAAAALCRWPPSTHCVRFGVTYWPLLTYTPVMRWLLAPLLLLAACRGAEVPTEAGDKPLEDTGLACESRPFWPDADGDGFGAVGTSVQRCEAPAGFADQTGDCDDAAADVYPGAAEVCNLRDDDCDGERDDENTVWYADADGDGFGDDTTAVQTCEPQAGWVSTSGDCNDGSGAAYPGAAEVCNGADDDCDGVGDPGVESAWYADDDGDGYGNILVVERTCFPQAGWVENGDDCMPFEATMFPGAPEVCNTYDDNCDGTVDEGFDADGDGSFGAECSFGDDCDDARATTFPGAPEVCENGTDEDCDGADVTCGLGGAYDLGTDASVTLGSGSLANTGYVMLAGDATGDGIDDIFTAFTTVDGGYLVPGPLSGTQDLDSVGTSHRGNGGSVSGAGRSIGMADVNGDGLQDLGFGAPYGSAGGWYVVAGPASTSTALDTDYDAYISAPYAQYGGHGGDMGDVTGDGIGDVLVGVYGANEGAGATSGAAYLVPGPLAGDYVNTTDAITVLAGENAYDYFGRFAEIGGDHDGDGIGDMLVAAPYADGSAPAGGVVYLVYGPGSGTINMADADGAITTSAANSYLGEARTMVQGDVDGDGLADAVVGSTYYSGYTGFLAVILGPAEGVSDVVTAPITIEGATRGVATGSSPSVADADDDGRGDVLFGASQASSGAGQSYLFWSPAAGAYTTADADATFTGDTGDAAGISNVWADFNGDGWEDVFMGAYLSGGKGAVYGVFNFQ